MVNSKVSPRRYSAWVKEALKGPEIEAVGEDATGSTVEAGEAGMQPASRKMIMRLEMG